MLKKPIKPWKNLEDARIRVGYMLRSGQREDKFCFPCPTCNGTGKVWEDDDPSITYDEIPCRECPNCQGFSVIPKKDFIKYYKSEQDRYKKELEEYNYAAKRVKHIISKLSKEDIQILEKYFDY
jgi:Ribonuclease G/E